MIKVSVIMACRNAERFIQDAIDSVLNQTYKNLELVIVDDASTDTSLSIIKKAALSDSRIIVHSLEKNVGPGEARNIAIEKASGEWLAILDADDIFLIDKLEKQIAYIQNVNSDIVLIGSNSFVIDKNSTIISEQKYPVKDETLKKNLVLGKKFPAHSSIMYRADKIKLAGTFNNRFSPAEGGGEDWELWLRLINFGSFALLPEPLVKYRNHDLNISKITHEREKYGVAANICHWLRIWGHPDPSKYSDNEKWLGFLNWVAKKMREEGVFEYYRSVDLWRNKLKQKSGITGKFIEIVRIAILNPRYFLVFLKEKLFKDTMPKKFAKDWVSKINSINL